MAQNTPSWSVTGSTETREIAPDGTPVQGVRVYFTTGLGQSGSVFIPQNQFTVVNVRAAVSDKAVLLDQVASLVSEQ